MPSVETIFALSSGALPAGLGVIRISGPQAGEALEKLAGSVPQPRRASVRTLRDTEGEWLDEALVLWFPGPNSATGEDCAELHCHGGRAVVRAVENALVQMPGLRRAEAGEFTRRAFANGRIDLIEAEALGDLLAAETELQRAVLGRSLGGATSQRAESLREAILAASARVEQGLDFSDDEQDEDVTSSPWGDDLAGLEEKIEAWLAVPSVERLSDGVRVVLAGPPNAGKSSLFNALLDEGAAIVSDIAGTTRDVIERPVAFGGVPFVLVDTAGLRDEAGDQIEAIGVEKAASEISRADIVLWLGEEGEGPEGCLEIASKCDLAGSEKSVCAIRVSAKTGEGLDHLVTTLKAMAMELLPKPGDSAVSRRQRELLEEALAGVRVARSADDLLIVGEGLRTARQSCDRLLGRTSTEDMLDALFGRFCIGK